MRRILILLYLSFLSLSIHASKMYFADNESQQSIVTGNIPTESILIVSNRAAGTLSVIDTALDQVIETITLPENVHKPEPSNIVYDSVNQRIFVSDNANGHVIVIEPDNFVIETMIPAGQGIWHMQLHPTKSQLWIYNNINKTITIINTKNLQIVKNISMPSDLINLGGKFQSVNMDNDAVYITLTGISDTDDYIIKLDLQNFQELARSVISKNSYFIANNKSDNLYFTKPESSKIQILSKEDLTKVTSFKVPTAQSFWILPDTQTLYITKPSFDDNDLIAFKAGPHQLVITEKTRKLYLISANSSASEIFVYDISDQESALIPKKEITVGLNPIDLVLIQK